MTKFKTSNHDGQSVGLLDDAALEVVAGGVKDGCIPGRTIPPTFPTSGWVFKDVFAKPTLGTYH